MGSKSVSTSILQSVGINKAALNKLDLDLDEILDTSNDIRSVDSKKSKSPSKGKESHLAVSFLLTLAVSFLLTLSPP